MKKRLLSILGLFFFTTLLCHAQNPTLYGMTFMGGTPGAGVIFKTDATGSVTVLHNFGSGTNDAEFNEGGSFIQANNGLLYGMTFYGGTNLYSGTIFSYNISTGTETVLHNFGNGTDGQLPEGSLIQADNGLLYGVTYEGGTDSSSIIFSYDISTGTETVLHNFGYGTDGQYPEGAALIQACNGLLYGTTSGGGVDSAGIIFGYDISTGNYTVLHNFGNGTDGSVPRGGLIQANNGLLYGTTNGGGTNNNLGTIFSYNIATGTETDIYNFGSGTDAWMVLNNGSLIQAKDGLLYGMSWKGGVNDLGAGGGGTIFSYNINTGTETLVHSFGAGTDGVYPHSAIMQASNGLFYGTTFYNGVGNPGTNYGMFFSYDISTVTETVMHNFVGATNGEYPMGYFIEVDTVYATPVMSNICAGNSITLFAGGATTYTWSPSAGLSATTGNSVTANPTVTTTYTITGTLSSHTYITTAAVTVFPTPNMPTITLSGDSLISSATQGNQWYRNDTLIPSATNQVYVFNGNEGHYTVTVTNSYGCGSVSAPNIISGINQLSVNNNRLSIYPNPTTGEFTITLNGDLNESIMDVYNIMGEKIYESVLSNSQNIIDLSLQPTGLYFVYLKSEEGMEVGKVMLTR